MGKKQKVLIVEDEVISALSFQMGLENTGYEVCKIVSTGEDAVIVARKDNPDIVIMDINLAGSMDGFEAAQIIQTKHDIPIIFLTGYSDESIKIKADLFKKSICLKKPTSPEKILIEIEKIFTKN